MIMIYQHTNVFLVSVFQVDESSWKSISICCPI